MKTVLKLEKVILVKELNDKFRKIGESYEIANILEDSFLLRDANTKVAIGVVSFTDFEKHFVHEENFKGWTSWQHFNGYDKQNDCIYRTNGKRVQVKFLTDKVRAESCCHKNNEFNLTFGIQTAYLRCLNKALAKKKMRYEEELKKLEIEITDNERIIWKMINSLPV
jgi:hypothetical protein